MVTFPNKRYHTVDNSAVRAPFSSVWTGYTSCDNYDMDIYDREEQLEITVFCGGVGSCPPRPPAPQICYSSNVFEFLVPGVAALESTQVLGSYNQLSFTTPPSAVTENGWARLEFIEDQHRMIPLNGTGYQGLPVIGFSVMQFTNAGAAAGLIAQYGSLFMHKGAVITDSEQ